MADYQFTHVPLNRTPKKRSGATPEAKVTAAVDKYLKLIGVLSIRTNAGSWRDDSGNIIMGAKGGTSDKVLCFPGVGRFVALEVKSVKGTQSEAQRAFQSRVTALGGLYILVRSADELRNALVAAFGQQCITDLETLGKARASDLRKAKTNLRK